MKQTIGFSQFIDAFQSRGRMGQFSYEALRVLFDHLEQYEEDCEIEIELDVIAICCEYSEMTTEEFLSQYNLDLEEDADEEDEKDAINCYLDENTMRCGWTSKDTVIFQQF